MFAAALALLGQSFRGRDRGVAFGVWGAVTGVSTALGPVLGGIITTDWSWRGIFLVNVPIGVLAVALTAWRGEESKAPRSEEHTSELQSRLHLACRLLLGKKKIEEEVEMVGFG